jgi:peptide/nickel transport system ATP-binding protein/oligopeptide transport system ATP-binding protein
VKHIADRIAVMYLGRIVETAQAEELFSAPRHPYTQALLSAIPVPSPLARRHRRLLPGDPPSPISPPPGCHLHTRCPFAIPRCQQEIPLLSDEGTEHHATACHRWRDIQHSDDLVPRGQIASPHLQRLIRAFEQDAAE